MPPISSPVSGSVAITISAILTRRISSFPLRNTYSSFCTRRRSASISSAPTGRVDSHNLFSPSFSHLDRVECDPEEWVSFGVGLHMLPMWTERVRNAPTISPEPVLYSAHRATSYPGDVLLI